MEVEKKFRQDILDVLKSLDRGAYPIICKHLDTKEGYQYIEKLLIETAIEDGIAPLFAVGQLETTLATD